MTTERIAELEAALEGQKREAAEKIRLLEEEIEYHAWEISPAMAQAKIDHLNKRVGELEAENQRLRAFWEWSRLADKMTFEQYHWTKQALQGGGNESL